MKRITCLSLILFLTVVNVFSQNRQTGAYMIPPTVYVGDRASLIVPISALSGNSDIVLTSDKFPVANDIDIFRIATERRPGGSRLVIEFSAYVPGIMELPPFEIAGEMYSGLKIEISSILNNDESDTVLSGPADSLAIPGTSLLVYGTLSAVILSLTAAIWILLRGRGVIRKWLAFWQRKRLITVMRRIERRLRKSLSRNVARREVLNTLSIEFRSFLSFFTGQNCRAMTAHEFGLLRLRITPQARMKLALYEESHGVQDGKFLEDFFSRCDGFRFCGNEISGYETLVLLEDLVFFLQVLAEAERKTKKREAAVSEYSASKDATSKDASISKDAA